MTPSTGLHPMLSDLDLPLRPTEDRFLRQVLDRLRRLESRTRGAYAEMLVADHLPGARLNPYAAAAHDLEWQGVTIAIRTSGSRNADHGPDDPEYAGAWTFRPVLSWGDGQSNERSDREKRKCWADVAVLAFHRGRDLSSGWQFYVVSANQLEHDLPQRVTPRGLDRRGVSPVTGNELADAIRVAAAHSGSSGPS